MAPIELGALCDPISKQLRKQKVSFDTEKIKQCERIADAITLLGIKDIITPTESDRAREKLLKLISKGIITKPLKKAVKG